MFLQPDLTITWVRDGKQVGSVFELGIRIAKYSYSIYCTGYFRSEPLYKLINSVPRTSRSYFYVKGRNHFVFLSPQPFFFILMVVDAMEHKKDNTWNGQKRWIPIRTISITFLSLFLSHTHTEKYSQSCVQRPPLGSKNSGHCWQVVVVKRTFML